ncbi:MAG: hypothetical protein M0P49_03550 [Bacilli bacterium]|nr:hypothetical protein [Bacilli bacterium]
MEKKKACEIIDNILGLFDCINLTHKHDDIFGILIEMKNKLDINSIIKFIGYLRESETDSIKYNIKLSAAEDIMNKLLDIILRDTNNLTMKDYDAIHSGVVSIKNDILKGCYIMEKKEACEIIDNFIFLLEKAISAVNSLVLSETIAVLKINTNQITRFIEYTKSLETNRIEDNVYIYIVQTIMYDILRRIEEDDHKLTIEDFEDIHDSLKNINENFLHKEEVEAPIVFVFDPSTISLISGANKLHPKAKDTIANDVEKMNIISKLRKKDSPLVSNISDYELQPSSYRILIDPNRIRNINEVYKKIIEIYQHEKLCMSDLLDSIEIRGLTVKQITSIYAKLFAEIDNDVVVHIKKDDIINLAFKE